MLGKIGSSIGAKFKSALRALCGLPFGITFRNHWVFECRDAAGNLRWREDVYNLVVNVGLNDVLTQYFKGAAYTAAWFVGLYGGVGTLAAGDTMGAHAGWTETTGYSNANRPTLTLGAVAAQSVDNSASPAVFNINATVTVLGGFLTTSNTVGGVTGTLFGEAAFANSRSMFNLDTLTVTVTLTAASGP